MKEIYEIKSIKGVYIEINMDGESIDGNTYAEYLVAEGHTMEELLDNATLSTYGKDGESHSTYTLGDLDDDMYNLCVKLIEKEFEKIYKSNFRDFVDIDYDETDEEIIEEDPLTLAKIWLEDNMD